MAKYRTALEQFEYDPESSKTYLEFLGVTYPPAEPQTAVGKASNEVVERDAGSSIEWQWRR